MKQNDELFALIVSIFVSNRLDKNYNEYVETIVDYVIYKKYNTNTNLIHLSMIGRDKDSLIDDIYNILKNDTDFFKYMKEDGRANRLFSKYLENNNK